MPESMSRRAVPPVLSNSTLRAARARAKSTSPVLSETDNRARRMVTSIVFLLREAELAQLLAQRAPVDAEDRGGAALVARRIVEHGAEQGFFNLAQHQVVQVRGLVAVEVREVVGESALGVVSEWHFECAVTSGVLASPRSFRRHYLRPIVCVRA